MKQVASEPPPPPQWYEQKSVAQAGLDAGSEGGCGGSPLLPPRTASNRMVSMLTTSFLVLAIFFMSLSPCCWYCPRKVLVLASQLASLRRT